MFNFKNLLGRTPPRSDAAIPFDFGRMLNWKILRGSHEFPGPDGGTCVNEAAIIAAGYPYTPVRRIDDCPASFSRPMALYAMCINEIVLNDDLRQELLMPFVTRLANSADTLDVELERHALILRRTVSEILPEALERTRCTREARRCRSVTTTQDAIRVVKDLSAHNWHERGAHLLGLINSISMAIDDYTAHRPVDAAQYAGTAIADAAEVISSAGGYGSPRAAEMLYRQGATILDAALKIGKSADPIATDLVEKRMENAKRVAGVPYRVAAE